MKFIYALLLSCAAAQHIAALAPQSNASVPAQQPSVTAPSVPTLLALSDSEKLALLTAQKDLQDAQAELRTAITAVYVSRKIEPKDATICDNPNSDLCKGAPEKTLTLMPAPVASATPAKPAPTK